MTDLPPIDRDVIDRENAASSDILDDSGKPLAIYLLYLVALFTAVPFFIGGILAYLFRNKGPDWANSHFDHQVSLFCRFFFGSIAIGLFIGISIPLIALLIGIPMILVGCLALIYLWFWMLIRCIKGIADARREAPYRDGVSWRL
ncbi:MAG: hypothetical protein AAF986_05275 [Pseudomonadota bacterium]